MVVENVWGPRKFLFYYIVCGVGAGLCQELAQYGTYLVYGLAHFDSLRIGTTVLPMDVYLNMMNTVGAYALPRRAYVHHSYPYSY